MFQSADSMSIPSTPSTPCSPLADLFDIEVITEKDRDDVLQFLQTFFFKDEPLNSAIGLITDENPRCLDLETYSLKGSKGLNNLYNKFYTNYDLFRVEQWVEFESCYGW